jgi:hypothetical protein
MSNWIGTKTRSTCIARENEVTVNCTPVSLTTTSDPRLSPDHCDFQLVTCVDRSTSIEQDWQVKDDPDLFEQSFAHGIDWIRHCLTMLVDVRMTHVTHQWTSIVNRTICNTRTSSSCKISAVVIERVSFDGDVAQCCSFSA